MIGIEVIRREELVHPLKLIQVAHVQADERDGRGQGDDHPKDAGLVICVSRVAHRVRIRLLVNRLAIVLHVVLEVEDGEDETDHGQDRCEEIEVAPFIKDDMIFFLSLKVFRPLLL